MTTRQEAVTVLRLDTTQHDAAAAKAAAAIGQVGKAGEMSARQTAAAMRSLPAQFTDVATQLAGGQNPLLILLQQGGQVRDQFGSIRAAVAGVGSVLTPAVLGISAAAVGVGALAIAYRQVATEQSDMVRALVLSGNAAGVTVDQLRDLARAQSAIAGTEGLATEALTKMAGAGRVTGEVLGDAVKAAIALQRAGGPSIDETVRKFVQLGGAPLQALVQLNQAENFLTVSVYKRVAALVESGRVSEAAAVAQKAYADSLNNRAAEIEANLSQMERNWRAVTEAATEAWNAMLRRPSTLSQQLAAAEQQLFEAGEPRRGADPRAGAARRDAIRQRIEDLRMQIYLQGEAAAADQERAASVRRLDEEESKRDAARRAAAAARARAFDLTPPLAGLDYQDRSDRLLAAARGTPDTLGEFLTERVLPAAKARDERRIEQQKDFLQQLVDANAGANVALIADDRQRALAQLAIERDQLQRRIEAIYESGPERAEAERLADEAFAARAQASGIKFAKDTALVTREETRDALAAAFRDTKNPIKAFGDALGNIVFQRVSTALADSLVDLAIGPVGGGGGLLGSLIGTVGGFFGFGGARAGGGAVSRGRMYEVNEAAGPGELLRTRGGRSYLLAAEDGDIVPQPRRGGRGAMQSGAPVYNFEFNYGGMSFGAGVSRAEIAAQFELERRATTAEVINTLRRNRMAE